MRVELDYFAAHPDNPKANLRFEDLITLKTFDTKNEVYFEVGQANGSISRVTIRKCYGFFEIYQNGQHLSTFKDEVVINKKEYICHKVIEEDRFELVDHIKMPPEDTIIEEERKFNFYTQPKLPSILQISESHSWEAATVSTPRTAPLVSSSGLTKKGFS